MNEGWQKRAFQAGLPLFLMFIGAHSFGVASENRGGGDVEISKQSRGGADVQGYGWVSEAEYRREFRALGWLFVGSSLVLAGIFAWGSADEQSGISEENTEIEVP